MAAAWFMKFIELQAIDQDMTINGREVAQDSNNL